MNRALFIFSLALVFIPASVSAADTSPFEQLRTRLMNGTPTISVIDFNQCKQTSGTAHGNLKSMGGFLIDAFMILPEPNATIAYSYQHFTVAPDGTPVTELAQYRILANGTATAKFNRLSPTTFKPLIEPFVFECSLGAGIRFVPEASSSKGVD
ncbi:VirK family protein [Ochrobactrum sp. GPK 3]|uniref:VirK family protein n=1 Tax=Brucella sp. 22210 TaxID=3453892 RepID=UPI0031385FAA